MSNDLGTALWYSVFCFRFTDEWCFLQPAGWQGIANSDLLYPTGAHSPDVFISQWGKTFAVQLLPELALVFILQTRWIFWTLCQFKQCCACPTWYHVLSGDRSSSSSSVTEAGWVSDGFHYRFMQHVLQGSLKAVCHLDLTSWKPLAKIFQCTTDAFPLSCKM